MQVGEPTVDECVGVIPAVSATREGASEIRTVC